MSNPLDHGASTDGAAENPLPLEPPAPAEEVEVHEPERLGGMILVDADAQRKHAETAKASLDDLLAAPLHSPEFQTKLAQLTRLGQDTMNQRSEEHTSELQSRGQ